MVFVPIAVIANRSVWSFGDRQAFLIVVFAVFTLLVHVSILMKVWEEKRLYRKWKDFHLLDFFAASFWRQLFPW